MCVSVYILEFWNKTYYTGITNDIERRLSEHRRGYSKSTKNRGTFILKYISVFEDRKTARKMEVHIKKTGAKRYLMKFYYRK